MSENLNPKQLEAVKHDKGPLLIVAGAGSGKTKTLTSRIAHLIASGTKPERILAITFTNKAAKEMADRVTKQLSVVKGQLSDIDMPFIGTFHSWGARLLKQEAHFLNRTASFSIFDDDDALKLIKEIVKAMDLDKDRYSPLMFRQRTSRFKNELVDTEELLNSGSFADELAVKVHQNYEKALVENNAFDFDDLITKVVKLFETNPEVFKKWQSRYDHVLVDEYQDINTSQYRLIKLLVAPHENLSVVGDDAQSIYAFRFSDFRNFLNFDRDWPNAKVVKLEENYRSTANIILAANEVIKRNKLQKPKNLWTKKEAGELVTVTGLSDADEESGYVVSGILNLLQKPNTDPKVAILYRTNAQSRPIEQALIQNGIPYRIYGGHKFYERMEIKDILSALQYAANPQNRVAAGRLVKNFNKKESERFLLELPRLGKDLKIIELINYFIENTKYIEYLERNFKNGGERVENVNELIAFAGTFNHLGLVSFLEQVSLVSSLDMPNGKTEKSRLREGIVTLMTIHSAKGLEFNQVFVVGCNEGLLPHEQSMFKDDEVEEERRLMYVAMTRAKEKLTLCYYNVPSRFLYEIPQELTDFRNFSSNRRQELPDDDERYIEYD